MEKPETAEGTMVDSKAESAEREGGAHASIALERVAHPVPHPAFDQFVATVSALRAPDGCPWDREQTHLSIAHNMIEEAYEAVDTIEAGDAAHLREELGDVLLQVVLHSQIAADEGAFTIDDVAQEVNDKLVRRHPHVFGEVQAGSASEVLDLWDQVKLGEKAQADAEAKDAPKGLLDGVPASFPALMQAQKISRKAAAAGFEWDSVADVWKKVHEEASELQAAYDAAPKAASGKMDACGIWPDGREAGADAEDEAAAARAIAAAELEFGDVLFSLVNVARRMGIDAESALRATCRKFRTRWEAMEAAAREQGASVEDLDTARQNELWDAVKAAE